MWKEGHYVNERPNKRKKDNKGGRRQHFTNYQLTWNECNSDGELKEETETAQMAFMAIGDNQVTSSYNSCDENDDVDDVESGMLRMHESLKESYANNKEFKEKIMNLIDENADMFQENKKTKIRK